MNLKFLKYYNVAVVKIYFIFPAFPSRHFQFMCKFLTYIRDLWRKPCIFSYFFGWVSTVPFSLQIKMNIDYLWFRWTIVYKSYFNSNSDIWVVGLILSFLLWYAFSWLLILLLMLLNRCHLIIDEVSIFLGESITTDHKAFLK